MQWSNEELAMIMHKRDIARAAVNEITMTTARAFLRGAHTMNGAAELERQAAKDDAIALLTLLQDTTQSRSVAERCAKAKAVMG
jgi:hypothetical protein